MSARPARRDDMTNLTITVEADVLRRARIRALEEDDSVNAYLRRCLHVYVNEQSQAYAAVEQIKRLLDANECHSGGAVFSRQEIYERCRE